MKHFKVMSALLAAVMCVTMVMVPVAADETEAPSETQTTEVQNDAEESEENMPEVTEDRTLESEDQNEALDAVLAKGKCGKKVKWTLSKKGTLKITGKGAMKNFTVDSKAVPNTPWKKYRAKIKKVVISKKVTTVGNFAFALCGNLKSVSLSKKTKTIGIAAFCLCPNLKSVKIPNKVKTISTGAFSGTGLTSIVIPKSVKTIGSFAFQACSDLKTVSIPIAGVTSIGEKAFEECKSLTSFKVPLTVTELGRFCFSN